MDAFGRFVVCAAPLQAEVFARIAERSASLVVEAVAACAAAGAEAADPATGWSPEAAAVDEGKAFLGATAAPAAKRLNCRYQEVRAERARHAALQAQIRSRAVLPSACLLTVPAIVADAGADGLAAATARPDYVTALQKMAVLIAFQAAYRRPTPKLSREAALAAGRAACEALELAEVPAPAAQLLALPAAAPPAPLPPLPSPDPAPEPGASGAACCAAAV